MKIIELLIDEEQLMSCIEAISIVDKPAIEENFIALSKNEEIKLAEIDIEKKRIRKSLSISYTHNLN